MEPSLITAPMLAFSVGSPTVIFSTRAFKPPEICHRCVRRRWHANKPNISVPEIRNAASGDALDGGIDVGVGIHDDGIFAAHFEHGALDPNLSRDDVGGAFVDVEPNFT